jgi:hypothetical protein
MPLFSIIETDDGWSIVEHSEDTTAAEVAESQGAELIDPGPYHNYEDAQEALVALQQELDDDDASDLPGTQAMEGRYETDD